MDRDVDPAPGQIQRHRAAQPPRAAGHKRPALRHALPSQSHGPVPIRGLPHFGQRAAESRDGGDFFDRPPMRRRPNMASAAMTIRKRVKTLMIIQSP